MLGVPQAWGKGQGESYTLFQTLPQFERIDQKIFHAEIVVDSAKVSAEMKAYQPIPVIVDFTNEVGSDNLKETIEANYRKVKREILSLVDSEIQRIKNTPVLSHLIPNK